MTWLFTAEPLKREQLNVLAFIFCLIFYNPIHLQDLYWCGKKRISLLLWEKLTIFGIVHLQWSIHTGLHNESKDFLMFHLCFYSLTNNFKSYFKLNSVFNWKQGRKQFKKSMNNTMAGVFTMQESYISPVARWRFEGIKTFP